MESAWHDAVAHATGLPPAWRTSPALDLDRIARLSDDGLLGAAAADIVVPGLTPERPISPSALQVLLQCPYLYLLQRQLGFDEPACAPSLREIEQPAYGSLVHAVAEAVAIGSAFHGRRENPPVRASGAGLNPRLRAAQDCPGFQALRMRPTCFARRSLMRDW
ncbi:MAG TPA: PD-(D/E)XK nuclease family protein [Candidatus Polarisedimenticolia bacterium]|nr:PD-(D/E)XK nuclease family protein [Candidatus Polarisedimenticolia bacterium]